MPDHGNPPVPPAGDTSSPLPARLTKDERAALIDRALRLRVEAGLPVVDIAQIVGRHPTTVSRMLSAVRRQLAKVYQPGGRFDPAVTIAELIDRADRVGRLCMQQFQVAESVRDRLRALRVALIADSQKKSILQECGLLPHDLGNLQLEAGRVRASAGEVRRLAEQLRRLHAMPDENVFDISLTPPGEQAYLEGITISENGDGADHDDDEDDES